MKETDFRWIATWVVVTVITFFIVQVAKGQTLGINGAGFFENRTEQSDEWLHELFDGHEWVLRVPGGAIAKFADPTVTKGWGLTYAGIDSIQPKYGSDEEEAQTGALTKWKRKADAQPNYSYLDELVEFCYEFPNCRIIWVANPYIPVEKSVYAVEYLLSNSIPIVAVEMGNESYSQVDYNFNNYSERVNPLRAALLPYEIPISHPVPATGVRSSKKHLDWINALNLYYPNDWFTFHPYYDGREFPALKQPVDTTAAFEQILAWDFSKQFAEMKAFLPGAGGYMVTETNTQPAELIGDTELNGFFVERLISAADEFDFFCLHSGVSPDKYGIIYGTKGQKRNTSYYAFSDVLSDLIISPCDTVIVPAVYDTVTKTVTIQPTNSRCERFWFRLFHRNECRPQEVNIQTVELITSADTTINCDTIPTEKGCVNEAGSSPDLIQCRTGSNDDYLHPERFIDPNGNCYCDECGVVFDHRINTKFNNIIIPAVYDQTGIWIDTDNIDFYITMNGETVVFEDVFNWCENGQPTFFNTNKEVFKVWQQELTGVAVYTFGVQMIDRETGINVAAYWKDHVYMTLYFTGLW